MIGSRRSAAALRAALALGAFVAGYGLHGWLTATPTARRSADHADETTIGQLLQTQAGLRSLMEDVENQCALAAGQLLGEARPSSEPDPIAWSAVGPVDRRLREALGSSDDSDALLKGPRLNRAGRVPSPEARARFRAWLATARACVAAMAVHRRHWCRAAIRQGIRDGAVTPLVPGTTPATRRALERFVGPVEAANYPPTSTLVGRSFYADGDAILEWIVEDGRLYGATSDDVPGLRAFHQWEHYVKETLVGQAVNWLLAEGLASVADTTQLLQ